MVNQELEGDQTVIFEIIWGNFYILEEDED